MSKYIPGPWRVIYRSPCGPAHGTFWIGKDYKNPEWRGPESIGDVVSMSEHVFEGVRPEEECEATAYLIAAAPDLLHALKEIQATFPIDAEKNSLFKKSCELMDKAIAKAESGHE